MNISQLMYSARKTVIRESPTILTALGVTGVVSTAVMAVTATPKALDLIAEESYRREGLGDGESSAEPLSKADVIKLVWPLYIPAIATGGITIACIIGANNISLRRNAALASLYKLAEKGLDEYREQIEEVAGKNKARKVEEGLAEKQLKANPINEDMIAITGNGKSLFYDTLSGRYFYSNMEFVKQKINAYNEELLSEMYKVLNDFYMDIGLEGTELGRYMGWEVDQGLLKIIFTAKIATNDQPCIVMTYQNNPKVL